MKKVSLIIALLTFLPSVYSQQLMINEVSQGTGNPGPEYVEFVVVGNPICQGQAIPCIDIRKVIFDDNNGFFATGAGTGIASGALRFSNDNFWSCIPQGTYIIVYNEANPNAALPPDDFSLNDGNCMLVIPGNSPLLESTSISPTVSNPLYPPDSDWVPSIGWAGIQMANDNDSFQIPDLSVNGTPKHSVSWGNNTNGTIIYFTGPVGGASVGGGQVVSFKNIVSDDYNDQANWVLEPIANGQTPGMANSPENDAWIGTMNPTCRVTPVLSFTTVPASCGASDGSATVLFSGVSANNSIVWENGTSGATISNVPLGTYTVVVTDLTLGCIYTDSVQVINAGGPSASANVTHEVCMNGCDGAITLGISGGTAPYNFQWDTAAGSSTASTVTNLCPGTYSCVITDANGCIGQVSATVNPAATLSISINITDATCGNADGAASPVLTGGNGPFTANWSPAVGTPVGNDLTNIPSGAYLLSIMDNLGCIYTQVALVNDQGAPSATAVTTPVSCTAPCSATINVSTSGGTAPINFLWDAGAGNQTTANVSNLCAGTYLCAITDANNCKTFVSATIAPASAITVNAIASDESCTGTCDAQIQYHVNGAVGATTVVLTDAAGNSQTITGNTITGLCSGTYVLQVTDANGCTDQMNITIGSVVVLDYVLSDDTLVCQNESATLSLSGTGITNIAWSEGSTTSSITVTPANTSTFSVSFQQSGCNLDLDVTVGVITCLVPIDGQLEMPNVFTPNADGSNDTYHPIILAQDVVITRFIILNRWGNVMFEGENAKWFWDGKSQDGKEASDGTYYYLITYNYPAQEAITRHGFLQLVRD